MGQVVSLVKGKAFRSVLDWDVGQLKLMLSDSTALPNPSRLENLFQIASSQEKQYWQSCLYLLTNFALADEVFSSKESRKFKLEFLKRCYPNLNKTAP